MDSAFGQVPFKRRVGRPRKNEVLATVPYSSLPKPPKKQQKPKLTAKQTSKYELRPPISLPGPTPTPATTTRAPFQDTQLFTHIELKGQVIDEASIFGQMVAAKVRKLSGRNRAIAENQIQNYLFQLEMQEMRPPSPVYMPDSEDLDLSSNDTENRDVVIKQEPPDLLHLDQIETVTVEAPTLSIDDSDNP